MRQAGKNALIGLLAFIAIIALQQPWEAAYASQSTAASAKVDIQGQSSALPKLASASQLTALDTLLPKAKVFTFIDQHLLLESMQLPAEPKKEKNIFASAKVRKVVKVEGIRVSADQATNSAEPAGKDTTSEPAIEEHHIDSVNFSLNADVLFDLVNQHRTSIGKPPVQRDDRLMQVAQSRAPEIFDEIFVNRNMHAGFNARNLPYWASEIIIYYHNEEGALNWWLHSPIHRPILEGEWTSAGIGCEGKACAMIYSNFVAK